jgi:uncharacterized protein
MPRGKAAGEKCVQLGDDMRCKIFGHPDRPKVCGSLQPNADMCCDTREQALRWIGDLEVATGPQLNSDVV